MALHKEPSCSPGPKINMYNADCMDHLRHYPDNHFDWLITDPPYGINEKVSDNRPRQLVQSTKYHEAVWHQDIPSQDWFNHAFRVSKNQLIFGVNYWIHDREVPVSPGRFIWDKVNGESVFGSGEIAYVSSHHSTRIFAYMWSGMLQGRSMNEGRSMRGDMSKNEKRIHPTQKPISLYAYILQKYVKPGDRVLDCFGGSGSLAIVCDRSGIDLDWYEIDSKYYRLATNRFKDYLDSKKNELPLPTQGSIFDV